MFRSVWIIASLLTLSTSTFAGGDLGQAGRWVGTALARQSHSEWDSLLKDYPSARFRRVYIEFAQFKSQPAVWFMCGEVSSKGGFGAYGGWHRFALGKGDNNSIVIATDDGHGSDGLRDVWQFFSFYCNHAAPAQFSEDTSRDFSPEMSYTGKSR